MISGEMITWFKHYRQEITKTNDKTGNYVEARLVVNINYNVLI